MKNFLRNVMLLVLALSLLAVCPAMAESADAWPVAVLQAKVTLEGTLPEPADTYSIRLTPADETCPMPESDEITITGEGSGSFGEIVYDKVGIYNYTIQQVPGDYEGMESFDNAVYSVTVYCTNVNPENPDGRLELTVTMYRNSETEKCDVAVFHNVYKTIVPPTEPGTVTPTGVQDHWMYYLGFCAVMLVVSGVLLKVVCTREPAVETVSFEEEAEDDEQ